MKKLTTKDFSHACYSPVSGRAKNNIKSKFATPGKYITKDWRGTAADILRLESCPALDRLSVFVRASDWITDKECAAVVSALRSELETDGYKHKMEDKLGPISSVHASHFGYDLTVQSIAAALEAYVS